MTDGPFKNAFDADINGVVRREITTYRLINGIMTKETAVRDYYKSGDYHDSQTALVLSERQRIMWKLWIVSTVMDLDEPKFTLYDMFDHFETCYHAELVLEREFTQGEWTICDSAQN